MSPRNTIRGFALVAAMVFLLALSLIAVTAVRNASLEVRMAANQVLHAEAFEASEAPRAMLGELLDAHVRSRGWPVTLGGELDPETFGATPPEGLELCGAAPSCTCGSAGSPPGLWHAGNQPGTPECGNGPEPCPFDSRKLCPDARYSRVVAGGGTGHEYRQVAELAVFRLRVDLAPGSGAAMAGGYGGLGYAAAAGGAGIYFHVQSVGGDTSGVASAVTAATYRSVIQN